MKTGFTHELMSPLSAIRSAVDLIWENVEANGEKAKTLEYLEMVQRNVLRLEKYMDDRLIASVQNSKIKLTKEPAHFCAIVADVVDTFRVEAKQKGVPIAMSAIGRDEIICDKSKVELAISNILSNAIKFSDRGTIRIAVRGRDGIVECSVSDKGIGIPARDLNHIFEEFYQGKNAGRGSGLGLAIAKSCIEAHCGHIWVKSGGTGRGTTVVFSLPTA